MPRRPAPATAAKTLGLRDTSAGVPRKPTLWIAFPAKTGRVAISLPASTSSAVQSVASPIPSLAATRGARSLPIAEAANRTTSGFTVSAAWQTARVYPAAS